MIMRMALLGVKTDVLDEGAKNVATNLYRALSARTDVHMVHQRQIMKPSNLIQLKRFKPSCIMSLHGPSVKTIILLKALSLICGNTPTAILATQPNSVKGLLSSLRLARPGLIIAQSRLWQTRFSGQGIPTVFLPNGVDLEKFSPQRGSDDCAKVKAKLGITQESKVALHIGPVNRNRNLEWLMRMQRETDWQVVIVGSTTAPYLDGLAQAVKSSGIILSAEYYPNIAAIYGMADVYVFPVRDCSGSIEIPLTVLEAMACDRPVVCYPFRGLPDFIEPSESLRYCRTYEEMVATIDEVSGTVGNRAAISKHGWPSVAGELVDIIGKHFGLS